MLHKRAAANKSNHGVCTDWSAIGAIAMEKYQPMATMESGEPSQYMCCMRVSNDYMISNVRLTSATAAESSQRDNEVKEIHPRTSSQINTSPWT